jgi:hypothetical protein
MAATIEAQERRLRELQAQAEALELDVDNEGAPSRRRALAARLSVVNGAASRLHSGIYRWRDNETRIHAVRTVLEALSTATKVLDGISADAPSGEARALGTSGVRDLLAEHIAHAERRLRTLEEKRDRARDAVLEVVDPVEAAA